MQSTDYNSDLFAGKAHKVKNVTFHTYLPNSSKATKFTKCPVRVTGWYDVLQSIHLILTTTMMHQFGKVDWTEGSCKKIIQQNYWLTHEW